MKRQVRTLIYLLGAGLVVFGGMETGLEFTRHQIQVRRQEPTHLSAARIVIGSVLLLLGILLFAIGGKLVDRFMDDFDE